MKRLVSILSLLLLLAACTHPEFAMPQLRPEPVEGQHKLAAIDTLMQSQPDSALSAIQPFFGSDTLAPYDRHYASLLLSEALFKCDYEQTTRPALLEALAYFDSLAAAQPKSEDFFLLSARAHYMNGVGLVEADSVVEACAEYLKALEIMEEHFEEKDLVGQKAKFMALTYNRLGDLFSDHLMTEQALICFKKSLSFFKKSPTSKYSLSNAMVLVGTHFSMLKQSDSALYYFSMAEKYMPDTLNMIYRDILTSRAILLYDLNGDADEALRIFSNVNKNVESDKEKAARVFVESEIFYREGMLDSAQTCLEFVFNSDIDILSKIQAAKYLQEIHTKKGETLKAIFYNDFLAPLAVKSYEQKNKDSEFMQKFQDHQQHVSQNKQKKEFKKMFSKGIAFMCLVLFVVVPFIIYVLKHKHKKVLNEAKNDFEKTQTQHSISIKRMQNANTRLREENSKLIAERIPKQEEKLDICTYESMMRDPVILDLKNRLSKVDIITTNDLSFYTKLFMSPKEENRVNQVVESYCQGFINKVAAMYPNLGEAELRVCKFFLIGLTEPQIATLINNNFRSVWKKSRSIKEKMGCTDIHLHLKSIIFDFK